MYQKSAYELHEAFVLGDISAVEICEYYLKRIEKLDDKVGAFLQVLSESALEKARELDLKRKHGKPLGKLAGVPIAIKDNIHIKGERTTCASRMLANYDALFDATVIRLLKEEDAIIIGKTNLDEFAMGGSTEHSAFMSTHNPWNLKCTAGGSSGGSSAAVSARFCPLSLGSDTGGSVRQPAAYCGILGYKPTYGRISRYGLVAFGSSLDQIGIFAQNSRDLALSAEVLGVHCKYDATSADHPKENFANHLRGDFKGLKVGIPYTFLKDLPQDSRESFERSVEILKKSGAEIVEIDLTILKYSIATYYILATAEASTNLARFDGVRYGNRDPHAVTLDDVYNLTREFGFGFEVKRRILLGTYVLSAGHSTSYYKKAQKVRTKIIESFEKAFEGCDLITFPTTPTPAFELGSVQDPVSMYLMDLYTTTANLSGLPAISVPADISKDNKPIGIQFIAPSMQDAFLIGCAHAFERACPVNEKLPEMAKENA